MQAPGLTWRRAIGWRAGLAALLLAVAAGLTTWFGLPAARRDNPAAAPASAAGAAAEAQRRGALAPQSGVGAQVSGRIVLGRALQAKIKPDDTVFIFARLVDGPRMPVALLKRRAGELPLDFELDENTAMNPTLRLSASMLVVVGARISRSGQAAPQPGDLQGFSQPVPVGSRGLQIVISDTVK